MYDPRLAPAPLWRRAGAGVVALFVVAVVAGAVAAALAGAAVAGGSSGAQPEECCPAGGPPAGPTAAPETPEPLEPDATRDDALPSCAVGSWRVTSETFLIDFYTDVDPLQFRSEGREYVLRPDGTGTVRYDNVAATTRYQGDALRVEYDGEAGFHWSADETTFTFQGFLEPDLTWRTLINSEETNSGRSEADPDQNEVDDYECSGDSLTQRNEEFEYEATWERTDDFGVYG